jgi:hypothetical protein
MEDPQDWASAMKMSLKQSSLNAGRMNEEMCEFPEKEFISGFFVAVCMYECK